MKKTLKKATKKVALKKPHLLKKAISTVAVGSALGAILAAGAAAYFFTQTKTGKSTVNDLKKSAADLSKEISQRVHTIQKLTQAKYNDIVEEVVNEYAVQKKVGVHTVKALKKDLQAHWKQVQKELKGKK